MVFVLVIPDGIRRKIWNRVFGRLRQTPRASTLVLFSSTAVVFRRGFEAAEFNDLLPQEVDCPLYDRMEYFVDVQDRVV